MNTLIRLTLFSALVATCVGTGFAQEHERHHPSYGQALADLRVAREQLTRSVAGERHENEEQQVVQMIDDAMEGIKHAAAADGMDINEQANIDADISHGNHLGKAHELIKSAYRDIQERDSDPRGEGAQRRAGEKLVQADTLLKQMIARHP